MGPSATCITTAWAAPDWSPTPTAARKPPTATSPTAPAPPPADPAAVPFGYTGQYTDTDTALIYLRARYSDPATGQFLTRDPLEAVSGSAYGYAGGDPANQSDPSGLFPSLPFVGGAIDRAASVATGVGRLAHQVGNTLYNARNELQLAASVVAAGVCIAASAGTCALFALGMLAMSVTSDVYEHLACGASGSLAGQIAGHAALTRC